MKRRKSKVSRFLSGTSQYRRDRHLYHMYRITLDDYNMIYDKQNGRCAICNKHNFECNKILSLDHCHNTGKIRGLLCSHCNHGLGQFKDDTELLIQAMKYLFKYKN